MSTSVIYVLIVAVSIGISYLIFNWYMTPTKELIKEQTRLLRKIANEEEPAKDEANKDEIGLPAVLAIIIVVVLAAALIIPNL